MLHPGLRSRSRSRSESTVLDRSRSRSRFFETAEKQSTPQPWLHYIIFFCDVRCVATAESIVILCFLSLMT